MLDGARIARSGYAAAVAVLCVLAAVSAVMAASPLENARLSVVSVLPEWPPDARRTEEPEASGVVLLDGSTIVTALHVVDRALSVRVRTAQGQVIAAEIAGRDKATDIAVLKIKENLTPMPVEERTPELGEKVCAIGNAFGLGLSVTCGVVSALNKAGTGFNGIEDFIQSDAAVNPGASGGALVTAEGKFAGMLSAIFTKTSDANIGVNFAVSAPLTLKVAQALKADGKIVWPASGLRLEPWPRKGQTGRAGARVAAVAPGFPAEAAGFAVDDIILSAAGRRIAQSADFISVFAMSKPGTEIEIEILRAGAQQKLKLKP